ncbi:MAG TPA: glycosyltransferase [Candidatus Eremiobacteraceae bacterium]
MARPPTILFLSASVGEGHTAAAQAVSQAATERWPDAECHVVDSYRYASHVFHRVASNGYIGMVKMLPQLYRYIYEQAERATKVSAFKAWLHHYTAVNLRQHIEEIEPDVVVCTHAFPCGVMSEYKREFADAPAVIGIVTDFVVHPFWIHKNIDAYAVATNAMKQSLVARGVLADRVRVTGIPIDGKFARPISKSAARDIVGIDRNRTTLLLMGGGLGIGPLEKALVALDEVSFDVQTVVVVGKNERLERRLADIAQRLNHPVVVRGFVDNVCDYMRAADVLVSKPGGLTSSEALASDLPLVMLRPLPGQEERNTRYLQERGVGIRVQTSRELAPAIDALLRDAPALERMRRAARSLAHPDAAQSITQIIARLGRRPSSRTGRPD